MRFLLLFAVAVFFSLPAQAQDSYFNMREIEHSGLDSFPKWTNVIRKYPNPNSYAFASNMEVLREQNFLQKLAIVNDWGNAYPYIEDIVNWGISDYWENPDEFMTVSGDCEDYAIAKYYFLKNLGVPIQKMRVIIVQDLNLGGIIHAILGVYATDGELMILDNQSKEILPALKIYHYFPIYGLNEENWWAYYPNNY